MNARRNLQVRKNRRRREFTWQCRVVNQCLNQNQLGCKYDLDLTKRMLACNYEQAELRILHYISQELSIPVDALLNRQVNKNGDLYSNKEMILSLKDSIDTGRLKIIVPDAFWNDLLHYNLEAEKKFLSIGCSLLDPPQH